MVKNGRRTIGLAMLLSMILSLTFVSGAYAAIELWNGTSKDGVPNGSEYTGFIQNETRTQTVQYVYMRDENEYQTAAVFSTDITAEAAIKKAGLNVTITTNNGVGSVTVSGKPSSSGAFQFKLKALRGEGRTDTFGSAVTLTITVVPPLQKSDPKITTTKIADGKHGDTYYQVISVTGNKDSMDKFVNMTVTSDVQTILNGYGITVSNDASGDLILSSDKLLKPTSTTGQKFKVTATNDKKGSSTTVVKGTTTKEFTLKIAGIAPSINSPASTDITSLAAPDGVTVPGVGTPIKAVEFATVSASPKSPAGEIGIQPLVVTGLPSSTGLSMTTASTPSGDDPQRFTYTLSGTPKVAGTYNIALQTQNSYGKNTKTFTLTVLGSPDITTANLNNVTYGKTYTQRLTVSGGTNEHSVSVTAEGLPTGFEFDPDKLTISGKLAEDEGNIGTDASDTDKIYFGSDTSVDKTITFKLGNAAFTASKDVKKTLKFLPMKPTISDKRTPQTLLDDLELTKGTNVSKDNGVTLKASAPGTKISWDISQGTLPKGIESKDNGNGTLTIYGKPEESAKNKSVTFRASNGAGNDTVALKFNITAPAPTISADAFKAGGEFKVGDEFASLTISADGPVTWKATKLPSGLKLTPNKDDPTLATISGKFTAATKDGDVITITATDPNTKLSTSASTDKFAVYALPKISSATFKPITLGSAYTNEFKGTSITEWSVSTDLPDNKLPEGLTLEASTGKITGSLDVLPVSGSKRVDTVNAIVTGSGPAGAVSKDAKITLKGSAPRFGTMTPTTAATTKASQEYKIDVTGTKPIEVCAYIKASDAKAAGLPANEIVLGAEEDTAANTKLKLESEDIDGGKKVILTKGANSLAFKSLTVTVSADNGIGKPVVKTFKLKVDGSLPEIWYDNAKTTSADLGEVTFKAGVAGTLKTITISGDKPIALTISPKSGTAGLTITSADTDDGATVTITTADGSEAKKTKISITGKNAAGQVKTAITFIGQDAPTIRTGNYDKEVESGKSISITFSTSSGTAPISWDLASDSLHNSADLTKLGLTFDTSKGTIKGIAGGSTAETKITKNGTAYASFDFKVVAGNAAGISQPVDFKIGVKGGKPTITTKSLEFVRGTASSDYLVATGGDSADMKWAVANGKTFANYDVTGIELANDGKITFDGNAANSKAVKNKSVTVSVDHMGNVKTGSVKFTVYDPEPEFPNVSEITLTSPGYDTKAKLSAAASKDTTVILASGKDASGTSKTTWRVSFVSGDSRIKMKVAKVKENGRDNENKATLTATISKGIQLVSRDGAVVAASNDISATYRLTVTNNGSKNKTVFSQDIKVSMTSLGNLVTSLPANLNETPEDETIGETSELEEDIVTNDELTAELGEGEVTLGEERTVSSITAGQSQILSEGGYVIAAILPEISATADGQYGFEVDLSENVKAGAKLYWFAFPNDAGSEDDAIIDFFEIDGKDTEVVPENKIVAVYPWLRANVTYSPVIAVKAEDAESGEVLTEDGLNEAAESNAKEEAAE